MANFDKVIDLLRKWGVKGLSVDLARPIPGADPFGGGQIPTENEAADFVSNCVSRLAISDLEYLFRLDIPLCRFADNEMSKRLAQMNFITNCFLRDGNALIFDPLGQVIPCNILTETVLGRIGEDFNTAREYDLFLRRPDVATKLKSLRAEDKPACETCSLSNKCCRGCAAFKMHNDQPKSLLVEAISGQ
jgi:radical SAM protein with 4Fe4S-binding SPASM domain